MTNDTSTSPTHGLLTLHGSKAFEDLAPTTHDVTERWLGHVAVHDPPHATADRGARCVPPPTLVCDEGTDPKNLAT